MEDSARVTVADLEGVELGFDPLTLRLPLLEERIQRGAPRADPFGVVSIGPAGSHENGHAEE